MTELFWVFIGYIFAIYITQILDLITGLITAYHNLLIAKIQVKINELSGGQELPPAIGFRYEDDEVVYIDEEDCEDDEYDEEDRLSKSKGKIGFKK